MSSTNEPVAEPEIPPTPYPGYATVAGSLTEYFKLQEQRVVDTVLRGSPYGSPFIEYKRYKPANWEETPADPAEYVSPCTAPGCEGECILPQDEPEEEFEQEGDEAAPTPSGQRSGTWCRKNGHVKYKNMVGRTICLSCTHDKAEEEKA